MQDGRNRHTWDGSIAKNVAVAASSTIPLKTRESVRYLSFFQSLFRDSLCYLIFFSYRKRFSCEMSSTFSLLLGRRRCLRPTSDKTRLLFAYMNYVRQTGTEHEYNVTNLVSAAAAAASDNNYYFAKPAAPSAVASLIALSLSLTLTRFFFLLLFSVQNICTCIGIACCSAFAYMLPKPTIEATSRGKTNFSLL